MNKFDEPTFRSGVDVFLDNELTRSKSAYDPWGRKAIRAVDKDDVQLLYYVYQHYQTLGANINEQTTLYGYGGHLWTVWIHKYLGDTILHLAIKQSKMLCIYVLLLSNANTNICNDEGISCEELSLQILDRKLSDLRAEAYEKLFLALEPSNLVKLLPDNALFRNAKHEAWELMMQGRLLYTELPRTGTYKLPMKESSNYIPKREKNIPKPFWRRKYEDSDINKPYLQHRETKEVRSLTEYEIKYGRWERVLNQFHQIFYMNEVSFIIVSNMINFFN